MVPTVVETAEIALPITGMTCASCVNRIDRFLRKADGVSEVSVNLATQHTAHQSRKVVLAPNRS